MLTLIVEDSFTGSPQALFTQEEPSVRRMHDRAVRTLNVVDRSKTMRMESNILDQPQGQNPASGVQLSSIAASEDSSSDCGSSGPSSVSSFISASLRGVSDVAEQLTSACIAPKEHLLEIHTETEERATGSGSDAKGSRMNSDMQFEYNQSMDEEGDGELLSIERSGSSIDDLIFDGKVQNKEQITRGQVDRRDSSLGRLFKAASRPDFTTMMSEAAMNDPDKPPSSLGDASCHDLEEIQSINSAETGNDGSSSSSAASTSNHSASSTGSSIYKLTNSNTGQTYDIRELENNGSKEQCFSIGMCNLFPPPKKDPKTGAVNGDGDSVVKKTLQSGHSENEAIKSDHPIVNLFTGGFKRSHRGQSGQEKDDKNDTSSENANEDAQANADLLETSTETGTADTTDTSPTVTRTRKKLKRRKEKKLKPQPIPQPQNTLPVKCVNKSKASSDFNPLLLISTLTKAHDGPIWCSAFSPDGKYLATGGDDGMVQIWEVSPLDDTTTNTSSGERLLEGFGGWRGVFDNREDDDAAPQLGTIKNSACAALGTEIAVIFPEPLQQFKDHEGPITDLSWSHTNFLLSGSLDKMVRLWHPTRPVCLSVFKHSEGVTSVAFSPEDDRYFLSGGFDKKLRIWDIPSGRVDEWAQAPTDISSARYDPDAKFVVAGLTNGKIMFYSLEGGRLKYYTQVWAKNKGQRSGKRVNGIEFLRNLSDDKVADPTVPTSSPKVNAKINHVGAARAAAARTAKNVRTFLSPRKKKLKQQLLVSNNDSRLRLVGTEDYCMVRKYKGHTTASLPIKARFSESGEFIISGSETKHCILWNTATKRNPLNIHVSGVHRHDKVNSYECFEATTEGSKSCQAIVTDAQFVPSSSVIKAISESGLFPTLSNLGRLKSVNHDFSSAIILTCDLEGTMRVFLRKACLDDLSHASAPANF